MESSANLIVGSKLIPVHVLWAKVREITGTIGFEPIVITERTITAVGAVLYSQYEDTGLYKSEVTVNCLYDLGTSSLANAFANAGEVPFDNDISGNYPRVSHSDFDRIIEHVRVVASNDPNDSVGSGRRRSDFPPELRAAVEAFEAVKGNAEAVRGSTPKRALLRWLKANKPQLSENARERIATVANWQPEGGAPPTPG